MNSCCVNDRYQSVPNKNLGLLVKVDDLTKSALGRITFQLAQINKSKLVFKVDLQKTIFFVITFNLLAIKRYIAKNYLLSTWTTEPQIQLPGRKKWSSLTTR